MAEIRNIEALRAYRQNNNTIISPLTTLELMKIHHLETVAEGLTK